ncbi:AI-2E family transporter [Spongiibacter tropicus]|uniref:AI-2E family transporter n=1 Tax=Spongiibacter tropicus TaxID=454602 RepID=UPI0035BE1DA2
MRLVWVAAALLLVGLLLNALSPILMPFAIAAVLAYMGDPLADRLEARGVGRTAAVVIVFCSLSFFSLLMILITLPLLLDQTQLLVQRLYDLVAWVQESALPGLREYLDLPEQAQPMDTAKEAISKHWSAAGGVFVYLWKKISGSGLALMTWIANLTLIPVVTFYLLRDWDVMIAAIRKLLPRSHEALYVEVARQCDDILGAFARGQFLVMLSLGAIYTIGLFILGLDLALVLGLMAGLASIVPYLGFIVGIAASGLAAYFQFDLSWQLLGVAVVFGIGQVLESVFLTPTLVGDKVGLHPVMVIFAVLAGGQLFGFLGILLALPVASVLKVMATYLHAWYVRSEWYREGGDLAILDDDHDETDEA